MNFQNDITESYLIKVYEDLQKEQLSLMNSIKNNNNNNEMEDVKQQAKITKQISLINSININLLKLRNYKKKLQDL